MKILLVENDMPVVTILKDALATYSDVEIDIAHSRDSGLALVEQNHRDYDLAIFDLQVPTADGELDEHVDYGMYVFVRLGEVAPGTPRVVWSGKATMAAMRELMDIQKQEDLFGDKTDRRMIEFFPKDDLRECVAHVEGVVSELRTLGDLPWSWGVARADPGDMVKRVVNIFVRRVGGVVVQAMRLGGGFSGSEALRLEVRNENGALVALVVAKVGSHADVLAELDAYETYVAPMLPPGKYTPYVDRVIAGADGLAGAFYTLAEEYTSPLFEALRLDGEGAAKTVEVLRENLANWREGAPQERKRVGDIRRMLLRDDVMNDVAGHLSGDWQNLETQEIWVRTAPCHGDLHGLNVLVDPNGVPMLIDFGEVMRAVASLDPVTLELSVILNPNSPFVGIWAGGDPARWADAEAFYENCPHASFMRACREWAYANAAEDREVAASAYAYCVRQLKYPDVDHPLAAALADAALNAATA
jgi:hypothetical protein